MDRGPDSRFAQLFLPHITPPLLFIISFPCSCRDPRAASTESPCLSFNKRKNVPTKGETSTHHHHITTPPTTTTVTATAFVPFNLLFAHHAFRLFLFFFSLASLDVCAFVSLPQGTMTFKNSKQPQAPLANYSSITPTKNTSTATSCASISLLLALLHSTMTLPRRQREKTSPSETS